MQSMLVLRSEESDGGDDAHGPGEDLCYGNWCADFLVSGPAPPQLGAPPHETGRHTRRLRRILPSQLKSLGHKNQITARLALANMIPQFGRAGRGPMAGLQSLTDFLLRYASSKSHARLPSTAVCSRSRRAILRRARNSIR